MFAEAAADIGCRASVPEITAAPPSPSPAEAEAVTDESEEDAELAAILKASEEEAQQVEAARAADEVCPPSAEAEISAPLAFSRGIESELRPQAEEERLFQHAVTLSLTEAVVDPKAKEQEQAEAAEADLQAALLLSKVVRHFRDHGVPSKCRDLNGHAAALRHPLAGCAGITCIDAGSRV